jgi:hypothetical protein
MIIGGCKGTILNFFVGKDPLKDIGSSNNDVFLP